MKHSESATRIQTSILNPYEKVVLQAIVKRLPRFVTSDQLTAFGVLGAVLVLVGYALTGLSPAWLWLANLGFFVNWFGDSLDGTLARYRQQQRPIYGFFIDHNLDCVCAFLMVLGAGMSAYMSMWTALLIIATYLMLDVFVMINAHLRNEFQLTFMKLGPTELRLIIVLVNALFYFWAPIHEWNVSFQILHAHVSLSALDIAALVISLGLAVVYVVSLCHDAREYAKIDPLKKAE